MIIESRLCVCVFIDHKAKKRTMRKKYFKGRGKEGNDIHVT